MIVEATITKYKIRFRHVQAYTTETAAIYCSSADNRTELLIIFYNEDQERINARIDSLPSGVKRIITAFPLNMLSAFHHVLQSEKPITLYANNNNDYTQVSFGTGDEGVGEMENRWFPF